MSRNPDWKLKVKPRNGEKWEQNTVGRGWSNDNGTISIQLNTCINIDSRDDVTILLCPLDEKGDEKG